MSKNNVENELLKAQEYYKARKYCRTLEIYDDCYDTAIEDFTNWDRIYYAWSLYYSRIKNFDSYSNLVKNAEKILFLVSQIDTSKEKFACPYTSTVFFMVRYYANKSNFPSVVEWGQKLDHKLLSKTPFTYKGRKFPSNRERWYSYLSKALLKIGEYEDSILISKDALNDLDSFHGDNDIWFKFRIAKAEKELFNFDTSIDYLKAIINFKREWYVEYEIADNYFLKSNYDEALRFSFKAALNKGSSIMKTKVFLLISDLLEMKKQYKKANDHLYLIYALKKEHSFSIDESMKEQLKQEDYDLENFNSKTIENELRDYWNKPIA